MSNLRAPDMMKEERLQYSWLLRSHPEQYLRIAEETIRKYPDDIEGYSDCANYYIEMEQYDEALRHLDQAIFLDPEALVLPFERATVLRRAGRYQEALMAFDGCKQDEQWFGDILYANRATCHAHLGDLEAALAECAKIADDYNSHSIYGEFGGSKAQIIDAVRRVAGAARKDEQRA
jgi:tetratricopeptide (TPR) repeat protein